MSETAPMPGRRQQILIVDDEEDILDSLRDLFQLALQDVTCHVASNGAAALQILEKEPIDLIVSDYKMTGMNGLQFMEKARVQAPRVPRVMMTAFPDLDIAIQAINEAHIQTFFTKPLDPDKVVAAVQDILAQRRAREARNQAFSRAMELMRRRKEAQG